MNIRDLDHKQVCILGFGKEGRASYDALRTYAPHAAVTVADGNPDVTVPDGLPVISGDGYLEKLSGFDAIIKSPGIPWHPPKELAGRVTSATEIFLDSLPHGTRVVGITGTKGKSTTSNLIYQVLKSGGLHAILAGNIGEPMLGFLPEADEKTIFVLELSSYQLETLRVSPQVAVVTSFFPDHLDYHGSLEDYYLAKTNIARYQHPEDIVFYNPSYKECRTIAELSAGTKETFTPEDYPGHGNEAVKGSQNLSNLAAAFKVARYFGIPAGEAVKALEAATGLPHRQEVVGTIHGIKWIDDSAATTPQSTLAALETLADETDTIIVGGMDRDYDFSTLGTALAAAPIAHIVLFPDTGEKIRQAIEATPGHGKKAYFATSSMDEAVAYALKHTAPGRTCLLSSGSPSYNLFKNYPDRARAFREAINNAK